MIEKNVTNILLELIKENNDSIGNMSKQIENIDEEVSRLQIEISSYNKLIDGDLDVFSPFANSDDNRKTVSKLNIKLDELLSQKKTIIESVDDLKFKNNSFSDILDSLYSYDKQPEIKDNSSEIKDSLMLCSSIILNDPYRAKLILDNIISKF